MDKFLGGSCNMLDKIDYIAKLQDELLCNKESFSMEDVYNKFKKYINNKTMLRKCVELGIFHYDYVKYVTLFEGTLFEDGIRIILELCREAYNKDAESFKAVLVNSYPRYAKGLENQTQLCWLEGTGFNITRNDLAVKKAFRFIGDLIENSFKPYAIFLNEVRALVQGKNVNQQKLGVIVDALINYKDEFKALYKVMLLDVSISQWRNIADHGSYEYTEKGVEVTYGSNDELKKVISIQELEILMSTLDTLLYMQKTAYILLAIDYIELLRDVFLYTKSKEETWNDNVISQIVETSYAYGFVVRNIENEKDIWMLEIATDIEQEKQNLIKYCSIIANFLECYKLKMYRTDMLEYVVQFMDRKLEILNVKFNDNPNKK